MKLELGTVQFGIDYGITNFNGKTPIQEAKKIIDYANEVGIKVLDTAPSYGDSENVLGENPLINFDIITKTAYIQSEKIGNCEIQYIEKIFIDSLKKLKVNSVYGLIIHQSCEMFKIGSEKLYEKLRYLKEKGIVKKIGVSVYEQSEIEYIFSRYKFDLIQLPINVFDQRLIKESTLSKLKEDNVEIHARSILLQGILLADPYSLPLRFKSVQHILTKYYEELQSKGLSRLEGALMFLNQNSDIDYAVIGVNSLSQLKEIYTAYENVTNQKNYDIDFSKYAVQDKQILDPRKW